MLPAKIDKIGRISKLDDQTLISILGEDANNIQRLLEINDADSAVSLIYKRLIQSIVDLLPITETTIRESKGQKGIYQYNKLIDSLRGLIIDMQAALDRGAMGEAVIDRILRPMFLDIASSMVIEWKKLELSAKASMDAESFEDFKKEIRESRNLLASNMENKFKEAKTQTRDFLQR